MIHSRNGCGNILRKVGHFTSASMSRDDIIKIIHQFDSILNTKTMQPIMMFTNISIFILPREYSNIQHRFLQWLQNRGKNNKWNRGQDSPHKGECHAWNELSQNFFSKNFRKSHFRPNICLPEKITLGTQKTRYVDSTPTSEVTPVTIRYIRPPHHGHTSHEWMTRILFVHCQ